MPIGPQFPRSATKRKRDEDGDRDQPSSSSDDDSVGPAPADASIDERKRQKVIGPALPSSGLQPQTSDDSASSSDDEFAPALPSAKATTGHAVPAPIGALATTRTEQKSVQRDEWMTVAPTGGDWTARVDPTKLKNRKFNSSNAFPPREKDSTSWHETPEVKRERLRQEALGMSNVHQKHKAKEEEAISAADEETAKRIKEYNASRGPSLYTAYQEKQGSQMEDDPSARAFDREKDIGGGLLSSAKRREITKNASDFGSRFSTARYL